MKKLLSLSDDEYSLNKFEGKAENIEVFLKKHGLDGLELMRWERPQAGAVPMDKAVGRHMPYWPIFLDFWRGDRDALIRQFGTAENCRGYYYADTREEFVRQRREEFIDAARMRVEYVVVHASHSQLEHCYTGGFTYNNAEIIDAYIDMVNEAMRGVSADYAVLFENHWLPGLTFLDGGLAMRLMERVVYSNKGFVLDISHLMNTNSSLKDETEAVGYLLDTLERLGEAKRYIRAIHLNSAIQGTRRMNGQYDDGADFITRLIAAMRHVGAMDPHLPFKDNSILRVLDAVRPEFLVYELASKTLEELRAAVTTQNDAL